MVVIETEVVLAENAQMCGIALWSAKEGNATRPDLIVKLNVTISSGN